MYLKINLMYIDYLKSNEFYFTDVYCNNCAEYTIERFFIEFWDIRCMFYDK